MRRTPWSDSCPDFADLMSRFPRLKLSERLCILGLNPDAAPLFTRLMCRDSRLFVQIFQTQTLGATLQFWSLSGCGATLGATLVQTFQTLCPDFADLMPRFSRLKLSARLCNLALNPDAARPLARFMSRLSRPYDKTFKTQTLGDYAIWV